MVLKVDHTNGAVGDGQEMEDLDSPRVTEGLGDLCYPPPHRVGQRRRPDPDQHGGAWVGADCHMTILPRNNRDLSMVVRYQRRPAGRPMMSWTKQQVLEFLAERPRVGRLATTTSHGAPRVVPVWSATREDAVLIHTGARMAKARNIAATGRYALAVTDDTWPYRGVSIWGPARLAEPDEAVGDLGAFMTDVAVSHLGEEAGVPMGKNLSDPSWPHTILVLTIEDWLSFDYSK
jgi:hypothetical protein